MKAQLLVVAVVVAFTCLFTPGLSSASQPANDGSNHGLSFSCSHDTLSVPQLPLSALPQLNASFAAAAEASRSLSSTSLVTTGKRKLRILVEYELDGACAYENQLVSPYDGSGGSVICTAADILTPRKRALLESALTTGLAFLTSALYSTPTASLAVSAGVCPGIDSAAFVAENYDFVLFVTSSPQTQSGGLVLAWGRSCASVASGLTARPVVGQINFVPSGIGSGTAQLEASLVAHEITHALGFTSLYSTLSSYVDENGTWQSSGGTTSVYRPALQKDVLLVRTPRVLQAARKHFGCDTLDGVEIEDMGGGGTAGSHWKKRILFQEALVGVVTSVKLFYTSITLAFFEDAGFYTVDYSVAQDELAWGYGRGCPFLYQDCKTLSTSYGFTEFCFETDNDGVEKCTFDQLGIGHCEVVTYTNPLPSANQYFSDSPTRGGAQQTMDYCPFRAVYANGNCLDAALQDDRQDAIQNIYGNVYSPSSHCFESGLITSAFPVMKSGARCIPATCTSGADDGASDQALLLQIQGQTIPCPAHGSAGKADTRFLQGVHGGLTCPAASTQCRGYNFSGISSRLLSSTGGAVSAQELVSPYTHSPSDDCAARRERCVGSDNTGDGALMALLPRCARFAEEAMDCFGRRCYATFQQWVASQSDVPGTAGECASDMDHIAQRCVDGWEGATALCRLFTDAAEYRGMCEHVMALLVSVLAILLVVS